MAKINLLFKKMVDGEPEYKRRTYRDTPAGRFKALEAKTEMVNRGYQIIKGGGVIDGAQRHA